MIDIAETPSKTIPTSEGTPHLTINHEAIVDLDSSNAFEGMEANDIESVSC
jgi:S-adenosylmethionine decarboxylase